MECIGAQTRPRFILSPKVFLGNGVRTHVNSKGKVPCSQNSVEGGTHDAVSVSGDTGPVTAGIDPLPPTVDADTLPRGQCLCVACSMP